VRGKSDCTGFCTDSALPFSPHRELLPTQIRQSQKELLNRIGLGVNITHSRLDVIVPRDVLQRKRVGVLAGLGEKRVAQSMQSSIWMGLDPGTQRSHLRFQHPRAQRFAWIAGVAENVVAFRDREKSLQQLFNLAVDLQGTLARASLGRA
jgi:hypothetical protein